MILITRSISYMLLVCILLTSCGSNGDATPPPPFVPSATGQQIEQPVQTSTPPTLPNVAPTQTPTSAPHSTSGGPVANSTWIRAYGSENWIKAGSVVATKGGYYVAGFVTNDPSHLFVIKLDQNQEVLWHYQYGFDCGDGIGAYDWRNDPNPSIFQSLTTTFSQPH